MAGTLSEAYLMRDLLESHGVVVELRGEDTANLALHLPHASIWPSLWVPQEGLEHARQVVAEYESGVKEVEVSPSWRCTKCGEESEELFSACWSCGTERASQSPR